MGDYDTSVKQGVSLMKALKLLDRLDLSDSRVTAAQKVKVLSVDSEGAGEVAGRSGEVYHVTMGTCTCMDWMRRKDLEHPCKHQIALALKIARDVDADYPILERFKPKEKPKAEKKEAVKKDPRVTVAFSFKADDPRYQTICDLAKEKGYTNTNSFVFDIVDDWLKNH